VALLDRGQAALLRRQKQAAGRDIIYSRGSEAITLTVWIGDNAAFSRTEEPAATVSWNERDYLFDAADLVMAGQQTTPKKGNRITETIDGQDVAYELRPRDAEPAWRYSDPMRTTIRVHLIRVKAI
jgi:hypothetical protein